MKEVTGIILAGGVSKRLGYRNKALLEVGGKSIIERVIEALSEVTQTITLVTNSPNEFEHLELPMFRDILPGSGSLGGIYTGLKVSGTHHNLIVACDMPFMRASLLVLLIDQRKKYDIVIPVTPDGQHPTCAIYSKNCIKPIESQIKAGNLKISDFFPLVRVNRIDFDESSICCSPNMFFNVNTEEDYLNAISMEADHASSIL